MNIKFENLKKIYGECTVLDVGSGTISSGKITGIIGPNGAGKTTLLNIIAGLGEATEGRVLYGPDLSQNIPRKDITLLFQTPYLLYTSVEKNIAYPLKLRKRSKEEIKGRVSKLLEEMGLETLAKQRSWRLSGGEAQKTALARAIAFRPDVLMLDEPTSNIDNAATADIESVLKKESSKYGKTIIIVSHNLPQIKRICDEVIFMDNGKIIERGQASEILLNPKEERTRRFIEGELLT
jgi:tungstate transport system ATP-binding protein